MPRFIGTVRRLAPASMVLTTILGLSACKPEEASSESAPTMVRIAKAQLVDYAPTLRLTGEIEAQVQSELSFRVGGRVIERFVNVGDHVTADQVLARLDPQQQQAALRGAEATLSAAEATLSQRKSNFERQQALIAKGYTTRRQHDQAKEAYRTAKASLETAIAQLGFARDQLSDTVLKAGVAGVITARTVEVGQVVQTAQTAFSIARDGPRDAVFRVHEASISGHAPSHPEIDVTLVSDPSLKAKGTLREVSPAVDTSTGTVRVKVRVEHPPAEMTLGAPVIGEARFDRRQYVTVPWSALSSERGHPAVWILDPDTEAVSPKPITIESYDTGRIIVKDGLRPGELVVTGGTQVLRRNQTVALAYGAAR